MRRTLVVLFLVIAAVAVTAQDTGRAAFREAEGRFLARSYALAIERYDEFLRAWPDSLYASDARYRRAVALYRLGRLDEAYAAFLTVEARYRSTRYLPYVPFRLAVIDYERGSFAEASARFRGLVESPPDVDTLRQSLLYLGKSEAAQGKNAEAIEAFQRLLGEVSAPEGEGEALVLLSDLSISSLDYERVVTLWERIDESKLDTATAERVALRAAEAYAALGRMEKAAPLFERLSSSPRREIATAALARLLAQARKDGDEKRTAEIAIRAENALRSTPAALAEFWLGLGSSSFREGRLDLARSYFQRIEALVGQEKLPPDASIYLAEIDTREGDTAAAYATLAAAAPRSGDREALLKTRMGRYAIDLGRWDDARSALSEAVPAAEKAASSASAADAQTASQIAALARSYLAYALYRGDRIDEALAALGPEAAGPTSNAAAGSAGAASAAWNARLRGELLRRNGKAADSLAALETAVTANPEDAQTRLALMALFFQNGRFDRVVATAAQLKDASLAPEFRSAASYMTGVAAAATGDYLTAFSRLDSSLAGAPVASKTAAALAEGAPWASYYRAWSLYRLSRFTEAKASFDAFVAAYPKHERVYSAAYLAAWSAANDRDYKAAAVSARKAADIARLETSGADTAERIARALFLEGTLRPFFADWDGALSALDAAMVVRSPARSDGRTAYTVRAAFEKGSVLDAAGRTDAADAAFASVSATYGDDPFASEAAYRRGELLYRAKRWAASADRFAAYRTAYPGGERTDGALYLGGVALASTGKGDAAILLWERLLKDYPSSRYRFSATLAAARTYREKRDWEGAFRAYTAAIAEFGDRARAAGAEDEAEVLRYMIAKLPEKAARLQVQLGKQNGAATAAGRRTAIELARFYIEESTQREAGLPLLDEVTALRSEDPAAAAEAQLLAGDYYALLESWDRAATAFLAAASAAAEAPSSAQMTRGGAVRADGAPEALYKAASARLRSGKADSAAEVVATLAKTFPASSWTSRAKRLLENNR